MFGPLTFVAMRQKQNEAGRQRPLVFAGAQKLIDDDFAELRFPQNKSFGIVAAEAVFEAEACGLGERRVMDFAKRLLARKMRKRQEVVGVFFGDYFGGAVGRCAR